jgi:hypothetical protein
LQIFEREGWGCVEQKGLKLKMMFEEEERLKVKRR